MPAAAAPSLLAEAAPPAHHRSSSSTGPSPTAPSPTAPVRHPSGERLHYDGATIVSMLAAQEEDDARIEKEEKARKEAEWAAKKAAREEAKGLQAKGVRPGARYSNGARLPPLRSRVRRANDAHVSQLSIGPRKGTAPARKSAAPDGALTPREQHAVNSPRKGPPAKFPPNAFVTPAPTAKENHA